MLDGQLVVTGNRERAACWLARAAFEQIVHDLLVTMGNDPGDAAMRTQLSCLEATFVDIDAGLAARAQYAWTSLSQACHQHAFELNPTVTEARHLLHLVKSLER